VTQERYIVASDQVNKLQDTMQQQLLALHDPTPAAIGRLEAAVDACVCARAHVITEFEESGPSLKRMSGGDLQLHVRVMWEIMYRPHP